MVASQMCPHQLPSLSLLPSAILLLICWLSILNSVVEASPEEPTLTMEQFYKSGKMAYTEGNWADCVAFMLRALDDFRFYRDQILWCRRMCRGRVRSGIKHSLEKEEEEEEEEELADQWMRLESGRALCLLRCRLERLTEQRPALRSLALSLEEFEARKPFHYLQFCYWKLGQLGQAVRAAFTFLVANPKDQETLDNLHFYMEQPMFRHEMLEDTWQRPHERLFMDAVHVYDRGHWQSCASLFGQALEQHWEALDDCRAECDDQLDWDSLDPPPPGEQEAGHHQLPEWSVVLTSFRTSVLRCRQQCPGRLASLNGRPVPHLLANLFEYLHMCQFNLKHGRDACQSVANALALRPASVLMRRNKMFYRQTFGHAEELFRPSKEVRRFLRREEMERRFVHFVDTNFRFHSLLSPSPSGPADSLPPLLPEDFPPPDSFDYAKLAEPLLTAAECQLLRSAADFFAAGHQPRTQRLLAEELAQRIGEMFETAEQRPPQFHRIGCTPPGMTGQSDCEKAAVSVSLEPAECGRHGGQHFHGCAAIFCELP